MAINGGGWSPAGPTRRRHPARRPLARRRHHRPPHTRRPQQHRAVARAQRRRPGRRDLPHRRDRPAARRLELRAGRFPARVEPEHLICRGFVWQDGAMRELPTLGGNHSFAAGVNNRARSSAGPRPRCTTRPAPTRRCSASAPRCGSPSPAARDGSRRASCLPFAATRVGGHGDQRPGQAVGISGGCDQAVGRFSALHAVLWDKNGKPDILRISAAPPGTRRWTSTTRATSSASPIRRAGARGRVHRAGLPLALRRADGQGSGDADGQPLQRGVRDQRAGPGGRRLLRRDGGPRAFLWQNGVLRDLNDLVDIAPDVLLSAQDINDAGQITGRVRDGTTGQVLIFVATPIGGRPDVGAVRFR